MRSLKHHLYVLLLRMQGTKKIFEKEGNDIVEYAKSCKIPGGAKPDKKMYQNYQVSQKTICNSKCYKFRSKGKKSNKIVIYIHGGGYFMDAQPAHWTYIRKIIDETNAIVYFPDYPLAPEHHCLETTEMLLELYRNLIRNHNPKDITIMGDSAGGGISLCTALSIKDAGLPQPGNIIGISPSVYVTSKPNISQTEQTLIEKMDPMLSFNSFDTIRDMWLGELEQNDYRAFSTFGDFSNLGKISIFAGTNDVLTVFSKELADKLKQQSINIDYTLRKDMFHCYILFDMKESEDDNKKIMNLILGK